MADTAPSSAEAFDRALRDLGLEVPRAERDAALPAAQRLRRQALRLREELERDDR